MTVIHPDAQAIIDRIDAHSWSLARVDRAAVEAAITMHLAALGLPPQPFRWFATSNDGYAAARSAAWSAARSAVWSAAWIAAESAAESAAWIAAESAARSAVWSAARSAVWSAAESAAWIAAESAAESAARSAAWSAAESAAESAARSAVWSAARSAVWSAAETNALSAFRHPTQAAMAAIWRPMADAFYAGLWIYWITPAEIICVEQPSLHISDNRLHREDGPAVEWPAGEAYYFWRGTQVPPEWITDRKSLTPQIALTWEHIEQRRVACEILGWDTILSALDARVINADNDPEVGTLLDVTIPGIGTEKFLRVRCGTGRQFALPVPPHVRTAIEAQAWTWGIDATSFVKPEVRT